MNATDDANVSGPLERPVEIANQFSTTSASGQQRTWPIRSVWLANDNVSRSWDKLTEYTNVPLLLIRGIPGSGKSTLAKAFELRGYRHCEADKFFMKRGVYVYEPARLSAAHEWSLATTQKFMAEGYRVVVSNTFVRMSELEPYLNIGRPTMIVDMCGAWKSIHTVPDAVIEKMKIEWEVLC